MDYHVDPTGGRFDTLARREIYSDVTDCCQVLGGADSGRGGDDVKAPPCQLADEPAAQDPAGTGDQDSQGSASNYCPALLPHVLAEIPGPSAPSA